MTAYRPVLRWAWRLFRREWRQQILVLAMMTVAVTAAVVGGSALSGTERAAYGARHGTANQVITFYRPKAEDLKANLVAAAEHFGAVDVISRRGVEVPGLRGWIELRAQDPDGPYGRPMLALVEGTYPDGPDQLAVTPRLAALFNLRIGSRFAHAEGRAVVGIVENPTDLDDEFALLAPDRLTDPHRVTVLVRGSADQQASFAPPNPGSMGHAMEDGPSPATAAGLNLLALTLVTMAIVAFVGTAGFLVLAQRRSRQLAMFAATGATDRHLRLVVIANGAVVGLAAAAAGIGLGLLAWYLVAPALELVVGARLARMGVLPWWSIATCVVITLAAAVVSAWWPARTMSRVPIVAALSGRPGDRRPSRRSAAGAVFFLTVGATYVLLAGDPSGHLISGALRGVGMVSLVVGVLLLSPMLVRAVSAGAGWTPVAVRLALRDLGRQQARSGAALAAVGLALGIAVAAVVMTRAAEYTEGVGALSERQLLITESGGRIRELVTTRTPEQVAKMRARVGQIVADLDDPKVVALQMAVDPDRRPTAGRRPGDEWRPAVLVGNGPRTERPGPLFVATPDLLELYGADPRPQTDVLTARRGEIGLRYQIQEELVANVERLDAPPLSLAPTSLITREGLRRRGWVPAHAGWLVEAASPLTTTQFEEAMRAADEAGLAIKVRDNAGTLADLYALRAGAVTAGVILALAVLALAGGLIRAESSGDLRTLTAVGAARRTRRVLSSVTAAALALLGVVLGAAGAYLTTVMGLVEEPAALIPVPMPELLIVAAGVPVAAAVAGWLLPGREPRGLHRQPIE